MSGWGILASGLAGGAQAVGNITAGYIDQERRLQSAQALSDIDEQKWARIDEARARNAKEHQKYMTVGEGADDALKFAERKAGVERDAKVADVRATIPVEVEKADALRPGKVADAEAVSGIATKAEIERAKAMLPLEVARAYAIADASGKASAKHRQEPGAELAAKLSIVEKTLGRALTEPEKLGLLGLAKGRDPELDTQTVTEEKINPDGSTTKIQRKEVRRPGADGSSGSKPPESTAHAQAQAAISAGASPEAVNKRLAESGYAPLPSAATAKKPAGILPAAAQPAAADTDPLAGLSRSQVRDKRAELIADRQRWSGKPGADARLAEIDMLISRIDSGQY